MRHWRPRLWTVALLTTGTALANPPVSLHLDSLDTRHEEPVIAGTPVPADTWPQVVGIVENGDEVTCTGTLLTPDWILTAAHCLGLFADDLPSHALVGSVDWASGIGELVPIAEAIAHPDSSSDLALLRLAYPVDESLQPPAVECVLEHLYEGAPAWIVGFGFTDFEDKTNTVLREGPQTILSPDCSIESWGGLPTDCIPGAEVLAEGDGVHACHRDSGGPLLVDTPDGRFQTGITARPVRVNRSCDGPTVFTRLDAFLPWLLTHVPAEQIQWPSCNQPPILTATPLTRDGDHWSSVVEGSDPDGPDALPGLRIAVPPESAQAVLEGSTLRVFPDEGFVGADTLTLSVTDTDHPAFPLTGAGHTVELDVAWSIPAPAEESPENTQAARSSPSGCACSAVAAPSSAPGLLAVLASGLRRTRR